MDASRPDTPSSRNTHPKLSAAVVLGLVLLMATRSVFPERSANAEGFQAIPNLVFLIALFLFLLWISAGIGGYVARFIAIRGFNVVEELTLQLVLGLSSLAYLVFLLAAFGCLSVRTVSLLLILAALLSIPGQRFTPDLWGTLLRRVTSTWRDLTWEYRVYAILILTILMFVALQSLTPPIGYDALMYHLEAPQVFLERGAIVPLPENWPANGPLTPQMLFMIGVAFGSDSLAKLLHATMFIMLCLLVVQFGRRFLNLRQGLVAGVLLVGIPIMPFWAGLAYADLFWAFYEFASVYCFFAWHQSQQRSWLFLSAIFAGLGMGTKYLAIGQVAIILLLILISNFRSGKRIFFMDIVKFGLIAGLVGSPWYIKNWIELQNPVFPFVLGGPGWPQARVHDLVEYHRSFSTGTSLADYLLLPINIYLEYQRFGTFGGSIEIPNPLFLLVLSYPWAKHSATTNLLAIAALGRFILWAAGSQQIRHLLPLFPLLAILTSWILYDLAGKRRVGKPVILLRQGLLTGLLLVTLIYGSIYFSVTQPLRVIIGSESKSDFLSRNVHDYQAVTHITSHLSENARVLFLWDAQGYYCDSRCIPDSDHRQWTRLVGPDLNIESTTERLREMGVSHLLFSIPDVSFILAHDPSGLQAEALDFLITSYNPACTKTIFENEATQLLELDC